MLARLVAPINWRGALHCNWFLSSLASREWCFSKLYRESCLSDITRRLLKVQKRARASSWTRKMSIVADRLAATYGAPTLGNFRDPVKEVFFILLSARTDETLYVRAFRKLFRRFSKIAALAKANLAEIEQCIFVAGLGKKRARHVRDTARRLQHDLGVRPQKELRAMSARRAYDYLTSLPGIGPKSALCVMMYSLDFDVFPVDANVQRVLERMGAIRKGLKHYQAQRRLVPLVPNGRSKYLHVGLVMHGRTTCTPRRPKCEPCIISDLCSKRM